MTGGGDHLESSWAPIGHLDQFTSFYAPLALNCVRCGSLCRGKTF